MIRICFITLLLLNLIPESCNILSKKINNPENYPVTREIKLPEPVYTSDISIEEALLKRRSVRRYSNEPIELKDIAQLLWAAQGITSELKGGRTAPSAGAIYPLEVFVASGNINNLVPGVYQYQPSGHLLQLITEGDKLNALANAAHLQGSINRSAAVIIITADYSRTTKKYSDRGIRYVQLEAGHAAQNICLQAVSLKMGTVTIGSFKDSLIKQILSLPNKLEPLYLIPVGRKKD